MSRTHLVNRRVLGMGGAISCHLASVRLPSRGGRFLSLSRPLFQGGVTTKALPEGQIRRSYPQISGLLVASEFVKPNTKRVVARAVGGTAVGLAVAWAAGRVFKGVPRAGLVTLLVTALAHQEFDSPASNWVYRQLP